MLLSLYIKNIAVFDEASVDFVYVPAEGNDSAAEPDNCGTAANAMHPGGFFALTGETGAGKSILVDAVGLLLGGKASRELLRSGADRAQVAAVFSVRDPEAIAQLEEAGVFLEEGELAVSREILADGRNICRIGGRPTTVSALREVGLALINIHGQSESLSLYRRETHVGYLDRFGGLLPLLAEYRSALAVSRAAEERLSELSERQARREERIAELSAASEELFAANLREDEEEQLKERRQAFMNQEKILSAAATAYGALYGGEEGAGALDLLQRAERALSDASRYDGSLRPLCERLMDLCALTGDAAEDARRVLDGLDFSPGELEEIEERLDLLSRLKRKYQRELPELIAYRDEADRELAELQDFAGALRQAQEAYDAARQTLAEKAGNLTERRKNAAQELKERVQSELTGLDMPGVTFQIDIRPAGGEGRAEFLENGADFVEFLISANPGEAVKPISKIASGGEMARILLAIKSVLSGAEPVETLIFDEIDTGVSGRAAQKIAQKMHELSTGKQVMAVTHLPQIAAMADVHFLVSKQVRGGRTFAQVTALSGTQRAEEIARMTGGMEITETTLKSAREMLAQAADFRAGKKNAGGSV